MTKLNRKAVYGSPLHLLFLQWKEIEMVFYVRMLSILKTRIGFYKEKKLLPIRQFAILNYIPKSAGIERFIRLLWEEMKIPLYEYKNEKNIVIIRDYHRIVASKNRSMVYFFHKYKIFVKNWEKIMYYFFYKYHYSTFVFIQKLKKYYDNELLSVRQASIENYNRNFFK